MSKLLDDRRVWHQGGPTQPGYYWTMREHWSDDEPELVKVWLNKGAWWWRNVDTEEGPVIGSGLIYWLFQPIPIRAVHDGAA